MVEHRARKRRVRAWVNGACMINHQPFQLEAQKK